MNNEQNEFYSSISKYYAEIFPYQPMQLQFVKNRAGELAGKTNSGYWLCHRRTGFSTGRSWSKGNWY
jgi:hypothetical protein